jgi:hypothetical protein
VASVDFLILDAAAGRSPLDNGMAHGDFRCMQPLECASPPNLQNGAP